MFEAGHSLCSEQDIPCVRSRTFLVLRTKDFVCPNHQQCTCHFLVNSTNRLRIWANRNQICPNPGRIGRIRQKMACEFSNFKRLKNREDGSDFDDFLTKTLATARSSFSEIFAIACLVLKSNLVCNHVPKLPTTLLGHSVCHRIFFIPLSKICFITNDRELKKKKN